MTVPDAPSAVDDSWRLVAGWLLMAMPLLVMVSQSSVGIVTLIWLIFSVLAWRMATQVVAATVSLRNPVVFAFVLFPCVAAGLVVAFGGNWAVVDNPSRFVMVLPVIVVVAGLAPSPAPYFTAQAIAGCYVGLFGMYQVLVQGIVPAGGITNPNKFGYVAATFALLCLAAIRLRRPLRPPWWVLATGMSLALAAMLLSGTRGTWIAFAVALSAWFLFSRSLRLRTRALTVVGLGFGAVFFALIEGTVVQQRWIRTGEEVTEYLAGDWQHSSIGERFELWRAAIMMIHEHPITGVGLGNYPKFLQELVAQGLINPQVVLHGHAHNEYLNWFATGGIAGLIGVSLVLLLPLVYFVQHARRASANSKRPRRTRPQAEESGALFAEPATGSEGHRVAQSPFGPARAEVYRASALAGSLFVLSTAVFCLTDAFFYIHFATLYYAFTVAVLVGFVESARA